VEGLNERQEHALICFRVSDGGITWERVEGPGRAYTVSKGLTTGGRLG
jgi:hypothetical protein